MWGQGVGGGDAVDDGGEDGAVEELHHGEHLQEGLVEEHHQHHRAKRDPGGGQAGPGPNKGQRMYLVDYRENAVNKKRNIIRIVLLIYFEP